MRRRMDEYKSLVVLSARLAHSWKEEENITNCILSLANYRPAILSTDNVQVCCKVWCCNKAIHEFERFICASTVLYWRYLDFFWQATIMQSWSVHAYERSYCTCTALYQRFNAFRRTSISSRRYASTSVRALLPSPHCTVWALLCYLFDKIH